MPRIAGRRLRFAACLAIWASSYPLCAAETSTTESSPVVRATAGRAAARAGAGSRVAAPQHALVRAAPEVLQAEMIPAWTLGDLEQAALNNNPTIGRARALISAAQGNRYQVGLAPNPRVGYSGQQLGSGGLAEQHGFIFEQEFVRRDKLNLNRAAASQEVERTRMELVAQEQRVVTDVRIQFFETLIAEKRLTLVRELLRLSEKSVQTSHKLFDAQEIARHSVLQAEIAHEAARNAHVSAENHFRAAMRALAAITGLAELEKHPLQGDVETLPPPIEWEPTLVRTMASSPELASAAAEIERTRAVWSRAAVENKPNMVVQGLVNPIDNGIQGKPDGAVQFLMPVPLWNKNQGAISQAYYEHQAAQQALAALELDLKNRLAPVFEKYETTGNQVQRYRAKILPHARESIKLVEKGYAAGEVPFDNVIDALRIYNEANQNYLDALRNHHAARSEIEGLLLKDSLSSRK
ncbi:MAG: TolC family protein [Pirellulales bacterium]